MKRTVLDRALTTAWWLMLIWGLMVKDWWLFAPAAFLILLDRIGPKK